MTTRRGKDRHPTAATEPERCSTTAIDDTIETMARERREAPKPSQTLTPAHATSARPRKLQRADHGPSRDTREIAVLNVHHRKLVPLHAQLAQRQCGLAQCARHPARKLAMNPTTRPPWMTQWHNSDPRATCTPPCTPRVALLRVPRSSSLRLARWPKVGRSRARLGRFRAESAPFPVYVWPMSGQVWSSSGQVWSDSEAGRSRPMSYRVEPSLIETCRVWPRIDRNRNNVGRIQRKLARTWPVSAGGRAGGRADGPDFV